MQINLKEKLDSLDVTKDKLNFGKSSTVQTHFDIDGPVESKKKSRYGEKTRLVVGLPIHQQFTLAQLWDKPPNFHQFSDISIREIRLKKVESLAEEYVHRFLKMKHQEENRSIPMESCSICFEDYDPDDRVRETQCQHVFHSMCIMMLAKQKIWSDKTTILHP